MRLIDISQEIKTGMRRYASDPQVRIARFKSLEKNNSCNLLKLTLGSHSGTHIDAPRHVFNQGGSVDKIKLKHLFCNVYVADIQDFFKDMALKRIDLKGIKGVLFKAEKNKACLTVSEARVLTKRKLWVVGIEGLSIEDAENKTHPVHQLLLGNNTAIIEGLNLRRVKTGYYKLICLPLKIKNGDGAPARAILIND